MIKLYKVLLFFISLLLVFFGTFLKVRLPFPVWSRYGLSWSSIDFGITSQQCLIYFISLSCGGETVFISQIVYFFLGIIGLPIFFYGGGIYYLKYPTLGYIIGSLISTWFIGKSSLFFYIKPFTFIKVSLINYFFIHLLGILYLMLFSPTWTEWIALILRYSIIPLPSQLFSICLFSIIAFIVQEFFIFLKKPQKIKTSL
uniref:Biotin transporter BioY-like protein n=1 Tax=Gloeochaete wittrockiana TaxID=38269 RepID=A0A3G1IW30_9EUKA|nr:biotin transporter BioY-like protein [Gloeochaete wittrockiana]ASQ40241.1 biotin transporter BioY-like protein [Gloeochaete wittrockiana]